MPALFLFGWLLVFLVHQPLSIFGGDSGDLAAAAAVCGIPHPPGYPLYSLISCLITKLPLFSVAWRVALLSSVPHNLSLLIILLIIFRLTKSRLLGLFGMFVIGANYVFFLYSIVPEVFGLNTLFLSLIVYTALVYQQNRQQKYLQLLFFIFGLALTHHLTSIFLLPPVVWYVYSGKKAYQTGRQWLKATVCLLLGLSPYLYIPLAAFRMPIINWEGAWTLSGFITLITRSRYGTFQSGYVYGEHSLQRFLQIKEYFQMFLHDFTYLGVVLVILGSAYMLFRRKREFRLVLGGFIMYSVVYFFYGSYVLYGQFNIATYERFLIPSYVFAVILMSVGLNFLYNFISQRHFQIKRLKNYIIFILTLVFAVYPLNSLSKTLYIFRDFRSNNISQIFIDDYLKDLPTKSLVILGGDSLLFGAQYYRYAEKKYPSLVIIHSSELALSYYYQVLARNFPDVRIPEYNKTTVFHDFLKSNINSFPVFSSQRMSSPEGFTWIQQGLLFQLFKTNDLPNYQDYIDTNDQLWSGYKANQIQTVLTNIYPHLFFVDLLNYYATSRKSFGLELFKAKLWSDAARYFQESIDLYQDYGSEDKYKFLGLSKLYTKDCRGALVAFQKGRNISIPYDVEFDFYESQTHELCTKNHKQAEFFRNRYEKNKNKNQPQLSDI